MPITLIKETYLYYKEEPMALSQELAEELLYTAVSERNEAEMVAGQILSADISCEENEGKYCLSGTLECREMIGRITDAKIFKDE